MTLTDAIKQVIPNEGFDVTDADRERLHLWCKALEGYYLQKDDIQTVVDLSTKQIVYLNYFGRVWVNQPDIAISVTESNSPLTLIQIHAATQYFRSSLEFFDAFNIDGICSFHINEVYDDRYKYNISKLVKSQPLFRTKSGKTWAVIFTESISSVNGLHEMYFMNIKKHERYKRNNSGKWENHSFNFMKKKYMDQQIMELAYNNYEQKEIAAKLNISIADVGNRLNYLCNKYGIRNARSLAYMMKEWDLLYKRNDTST